MQRSWTARIPAVLALLAAPVFGVCWGCEPANGADSSGDADTDADTDGDADSDADSDADGDSDAGPVGDGGVITMDCTECPSVGATVENMLCAADICDGDVVVQNQYLTMSGTLTGCSLEDTYEAVSWFGTGTNGLGPKLNDSYAMMASGPATGTSHTTDCCGMSNPQEDPWSTEGYSTYDVMEWRLVLRAPPTAKAFRFKYVFFSEEYDDFISTVFNDRFYVVLEAGSTNGGMPTVVNFTDCREPSVYWDFVCEAGDPGCEVGNKYCYIAINSAFSDCCWYGGCPDGYSSAVGTDIAGTGYECAASEMEDSNVTGSSTGWLQTSWPINEEEMFALTFHIHDTSDGVYDSQVIIDAIEFLKDPDQGTIIIE